jgi:YD repeat-containing protein
MKKIRVSKVYHSVLDADKKPVEDTILSITEYSETGEVLREAQYHENELSTEITRMYENGRIISSEETDHVEGITQRRKYFYEGDRLTGFRDYYNDEDYIETRLEYDDEGRRSVQHLSDNDDEFNGRVEITYSPDGREITEQYYNAWDQPEQKITRTTDEKGNEIRTRT